MKDTKREVKRNIIPIVALVVMLNASLIYAYKDAVINNDMFRQILIPIICVIILVVAIIKVNDLRKQL